MTVAERLIDQYLAEKAPSIAVLKKLAKETGALSIKENQARFQDKRAANVFIKKAMAAGVKKIGTPKDKLDGTWVALS